MRPQGEPGSRGDVGWLAGEERLSTDYVLYVCYDSVLY